MYSLVILAQISDTTLLTANGNQVPLETLKKTNSEFLVSYCVFRKEQLSGAFLVITFINLEYAEKMFGPYRRAPREGDEQRR